MNHSSLSDSLRVAPGRSPNTEIASPAPTLLDSRPQTRALQPASQHSASLPPASLQPSSLQPPSLEQKADANRSGRAVEPPELAVRDKDAARFHSYDRIVQAAARRDFFSAAEVREAVGLGGRLVNQVLRLLSEDGLIVQVDKSLPNSNVGDATDSQQENRSAEEQDGSRASRSLDQPGPDQPGAARYLPGAARSRKNRESPRNPAFRWTSKRDRLAPSEWVRSKVYSNRITRAPLADRPRERLLAQGAAGLRTADLLAILIRSGNPRESAVQAGERIAAAYADHLERLTDARRGDLREISSAIGEAAFCQIMAGAELGRRIAEARTRVTPRVRIQCTDDARDYCRNHFLRLASDSKHEEFHIVLLNTRYEPIGSHRVSSGTLDASLVHPREVFRPAIKEAAKAILLVHNHPSGDPTPGEQDIRVTRRLNEVAKLMGIDVLDHIIVAAQGTYSLRDAGLGFD